MDFACRTILAHRFQGAEGLGDVQVGDQVRLFILFDRAAAPDQSSSLKFGPGTVRDREYADWAESEAVALADVLDVLAPQLAFDGARRAAPDAVGAARSPSSTRSA